MPPAFQDPTTASVSSTSPAHPTPQRFLVCLGTHPGTQELVKTASRTATALQAQWYALFVDTPDCEAGSRGYKEYVSQSLLLAEQLGATIVKLSGLNKAEQIINFARQYEITAIFLGKSGKTKWPRFFSSSLMETLTRNLGKVDIYLIAQENHASRPVRRRPVKIPPPLRDYVMATLGVTLCTFLASLASPYLHISNLVMFYLLTVVIIATVSERGPTMWASFLSVATFAFFFVPHYFSFQPENIEYAVTMVVMLIVTTLVSGLTMRVRHQARVARQQEWQTTALYEMNQTLAGKAGMEELLPAAASQMSRLFDSRVSVLLSQGDNPLTVAAGEPLPADDVREEIVAQWVYKNKHVAGAGTETLPHVKGLYVPLSTSSHQVLGVLRLERRSLPKSKYLEVEYLRLLEALCHQIAQAIERENLSRQTRLAQLQIEAERLRNTLLSSVSHDLRTPLTVIAGSASSLLEAQDHLDAKTRIELMQTIYEEAKRLDRLVHNLLEISRLQSGEIKINKEWHVLEEVLGCALSQMDSQLKQYPITITLPADLPLIQMDALLIERVLINLLENASKYTPPGTAIEIAGTLVAGGLRLLVADRGPGLPPGQEEKIFEKFYQGRPGAMRGAGLGLAICRSIIEAHGGQIGAANRPGGGAEFFFTLPVSGDQPEWQEPLLGLDQGA